MASFGQNLHRNLILCGIPLMLVAGWLALPQPALAQSLRIEGRTIVDETGRRVTVAAPFRRIVSLYGAHTENLFALGAGDRVIGVSPSEDYPPEARQQTGLLVPRRPGEVPGRQARPRPDAPMIDRGYPQFVRRLEQSGIAVVSLQPGTVEEMALYWQSLGLLTGREPQAAAMSGASGRRPRPWPR